MSTRQSQQSPLALFLVLVVAAVMPVSACAEEKSTAKIETVTVGAQSIVFVNRTSASDPETMGNVMGAAFGTLFAAMGETGVAPAGPPLSIYYDFGAEEIKYGVAFPIAAADKQKLDGRDDVNVSETYAGGALKLVHVGPYDTLVESYNKMMAHLDSEGLAPSGPTWEVYMNDPATTPPADLITEIYFPLD